MVEWNKTKRNVKKKRKRIKNTKRKRRIVKDYWIEPLWKKRWKAWKNKIIIKYPSSLSCVIKTISYPLAIRNSKYKIKLI
jgi:hypothetical protein